MRRPYFVQEIDRLILYAIERLPHLGLGCDLITGFPAESDADFLATRGLLERHPFSNAHVFPYSTRPGTLAAGFPNIVPRPVRSKRAHILSQLIREKRKIFTHKFKGVEVEIVIEDEKNQAGWTGEYLWMKRPLTSADTKLPRKALCRFTVA